MRDILVAIDLETTGLDASTSRIIEIGAVKFRDHEILETYSTLVDPEGPIPAKVTAITNIRQDDLLGAPQLASVLPALTRFVGDAPVLGHNVEFDLKFLQRAGVLKTNIPIDTYELASVLLPTAPRYNLNSLVQQLNLTVDGERHRALADAEATVHVYMKLWDKLINDLPLDLLRQIVRLAQDLPWMARHTFAEALQVRESAAAGTAVAIPSGPLFKASADDSVPLLPNTAITPVDPDVTALLIEPGGKVADAIRNYEARPHQADMARAVASALNGGQNLLLEAPPQTGRTVAYLVPAVLFARQNNTRVVLSTRSDDLRRQLFSTDFPLLRKALGLNFQAAQLKRRSSYLCPARLEMSDRRLPTSIEELRVLAKVHVWLAENGGKGVLESDVSNGDQARLNLRGAAEVNAWVRLSAEDEECTPDRCEARMNGICPFHQAHQAAQSAHIVVVDHALLMSDTVMGASSGYSERESHTLPDYRYLIVDEAHTLEESVTYALSYQLDASSIKRQLDDLGTLKTGLLADVLTSTRDSLPEQYYGQIKDFVKIIADASSKMRRHIDSLFQSLYAFLEATNNKPSGEYLTQIRLTPALHNKPAFGQVRAAWATLSQFTEGIAGAMGRVSRSLLKLQGKYDIPHLDDLLSSTEAASRHLEDIHRQLNTFIAAPDPNTIYWIDIMPDSDRLGLNAAPLHVGPLIRKHFWDGLTSVIMTSDSLRTGGTFDFTRERLMANREDGSAAVQDLAVNSGIDYEDKILLYLPTDMPEPTDRNKYQQAIERGIIEAAAGLNGRLLVLFTSFTQLRQTAQNVLPRLGLGNIPVFDQSDGTSLSALLDGFRKSSNGVLLGGREFWEGVDLSGDDVAGLVVVRLPFAVPSEPIFAARGEAYENSFSQFNVPDAILQFRRGLSRIIRPRKSRGIVALLDRRLTSKEYGQAFLESLPSCTTRRAPMADLEQSARNWVANHPG